MSELETTASLDVISTFEEYPDNIDDVNFVIEAIFENLELKKKVLLEAAEKINDNAIIASNTSSLSITEIAKDFPKPTNVIGMHFFNPVPKMPLVEIIRGEKTSDETTCIIAALASKLGKFPIVVEDVPGFLVNRVLTPYLNEAAYLLEEGYQIEDIDKAAKSFGMQMGPLRLLDEVGLDVAAHVSEVMLQGYGKRMEAPPFTKIMLDNNFLGRKNKSGFYLYQNNLEVAHSKVYELLKITEKKEIDINYLKERLLLSLVNEAILCLDEGIAGATGNMAARQIDLGTVMGIGFPPYLGGVIYYANNIGAKKILNRLQTLERKIGKRFRPVSGILSRAEQGKSFYE